MRRSLLLVSASSFAALTGFYLTLGTVPLFTVASGHGVIGGALSTTVFMAATVAAELGTTSLMRHIGAPLTVALGVALMAVPMFALLLGSSLPLILAVSVVRGAGFAFVVIAAAAMVPALAEPEKRGRAVGAYGVAVGVPSIIVLPLGVWLVDTVGFAAIFVAAGAIGLLGLCILLVRAHLEPTDVHGMLRVLRLPGVRSLAVAFFLSALAYGLLVTLIPLAGFEPSVAALALLAYSVASTGLRLVAGRFADSRNPRLLFIPALLLAALALALLPLAPWFVIGSALLFGASFGIMQNTVIHVFFETTGPQGYGASSAIWNIAFDTGIALGALAFGLLGPIYAPLGAAAAAIVAIAFVVRSGSSASSHVTSG